MGFTFCDIHSSKYNLLSVSNGGRYSQSLFADFEDSTDSVMGMDGVYYYGTDMKTKPITFHCFINRITETQLRGLRAWLHPKRVGKLVFDESPYKYYIAKISQMPSFSFVPHSDYGSHVYSGDFELEFVAHDPFGYSFANSIDEYNYDSEPSWYYDSGILYSGYTPPTLIENITSGKDIILYNAGNADAKPLITLTGSATSVTLLNKSTGQHFTMSNVSNKTINIDSKKGRCMIGEVLANSYHTGGYIELLGSSGVDHFNDIFFATGSANIVSSEQAFDNSMIGRWVSTGDGNWYKVTSLISPDVAVLDKNYTGTNGSCSIVMTDLNEISITGTGLNISNLAFDYKHTYL